MLVGSPLRSPLAEGLRGSPLAPPGLPWGLPAPPPTYDVIVQNRITEDDHNRITEEGNLRILE